MVASLFAANMRLRAGGGAVSGFVGALKGNATGTSLTISMAGTGVEADDRILMCAVSSGAGNEAAPPAGWATPVNTGGYSASHFTHDGSASYTFTVPSSTTFMVMLLVFRGYSVGALGTAFSGLAANPVPTAITVPANDSINVAFVASLSAGLAYSAPAGWTQRDAGNTGRTVEGYQRNALVAAGSLVGDTFTRTVGATNGRAIQFSLSPV